MNIARIAEEHAQLSRSIASYDHAPAELRDTSDLLESIEKDLSVREPRMKKLVEKRKAEHKDLDKLQRSSTKRFFVRIKHGGKEGLERKLEKEEREYIEAAQNEHNESLAISELKAAAENARTKKAELESQVSLRKETLRKLDDLYESAFEGPSPDFPEEDAAEDELREAEVNFEHVQGGLSHEKSVLGILDQAATCANGAQSALQSANIAATYDTFAIGGGIWAQMAEADDLLRAQTLAAQAHRLLERARGLQPLVKTVSPGTIVSPEWIHVVFDNMYTDFMFQQKIKKSIDSMRNYQEGIFRECTACKGRIANLTRDATEAREFLTSRRRQLVAIRREILARIREEGGVRVFTRPDPGEMTDGRGDVPQLPTYARQPEEGARVLAIGEHQGLVQMPVPAHEDQPALPPQYKSSRDPPPPFPKAPPPGRAGEGAHAAHTRLYAPPPDPPPQSSSYIATSSASSMQMPDPSSHNNINPASSVTGPTEIASNPEQGLQDGSNGPSTRTNSMSGSRGEYHPRTSFASNNPYRNMSQRFTSEIQ